MTKYFLHNNIISLSDNDHNIEIYSTNEFENYLNKHNLTVIQKDLHSISSTNMINSYNDIIYGTFVLTKSSFSNNTLIYYTFSANKLKLFLPDNYIKDFISIVNASLNKHQQHLFDPLDLVLVITNLLINDYNKQIEKTQHTIDSLENKLINEIEQGDINKQLLQLHKKTTKLRKSIKSFSNLLDYYGFITSNHREKYLRFLENKTNRLSEDVREMNDYIIQIKELYQNNLDVSLNNTMNLFTIISAIFLPLTLITSWYGMNLKIPEFAFEHGYLIPIIASLFFLSISVFLIIRFKILKRR